VQHTGPEQGDESAWVGRQHRDVSRARRTARGGRASLSRKFDQPVSQQIEQGGLLRQVGCAPSQVPIE
jgi:hypothetical protein